MHRSSPPRLQVGFPKLTEKENISKMKKLRNHSQFKEQENSPEAANNEIDLYSWTDTKFKRETVKILRELRLNIKALRSDMNGNAGSFRKELENISKNTKKLENSFCREAN